MKAMGIKTKLVYGALILPLIPLAGLCYLVDKLSKAKWAGRWVEWAAKKAKDITER